MKNIVCILYVVISGLILVSCGINDSSGDTVEQTVKLSLQQKAEELISEYNNGIHGIGFTVRDTMYPMPKIAWKHCYGKMNENYSFTFVDGRAMAILCLSYTEYVSAESVLSESQATTLTEYDVYDIYDAEVMLEYVGKQWKVCSVRVYSEKDKYWKPSDLFMDNIPIT